MSRKFQKQIATFFCGLCLAIGIYYLFDGGSGEAIAPLEPVKQVVAQTANNSQFAIPIDCRLGD